LPICWHSQYSCALTILHQEACRKLPAGPVSNHQRPVEAGGVPMSNPTQPVPVSVVADDRPAEVVIISHSPLFYWWPVWAVGFVMAALSYWRGYQAAFVPPGTTVEREVQVRGQEGPRDILIAPEGKSLPAASDPDQLNQSRLRMAVSNDPGVVWAVTLLL